MLTDLIEQCSEEMGGRGRGRNNVQTSKKIKSSTDFQPQKKTFEKDKKKKIKEL